MLSTARVRRALIGVTALVSLAGLLVEVLKSIHGWKGRAGVVPLLSLSHEQNVPTFHTAVLLLLASASAALLALHARRASPRDALAWWGLAAGFLYISVDEVLELHERWGAPFHTTGLLHFGWVIPASGIVVVVLALYARFLLRLPPRARNRLLLSGGVYVLGAVGMELPLGYWTSEEGQKNLGYALIDWTEETLEMAGLVLFLLAALERIAAAGITLRLTEPPPAEPDPAPAPAASPDPSPAGRRP